MKTVLTTLLILCVCTIQAQTDSTKIPESDSAFYFNPEIKADFPGGQNAWLHYLLKNLRYPDKAVRKNIQGTVATLFMVDSTGLAHDVTVTYGPEELRAETIRLVKNATWSPAVHSGKKVNSWKTQSITYKLD
jgi:protein TonB